MRLQGGCYDLDTVVSEIGAPFLYILDDSWRLKATYKFATSTYDDRGGAACSCGFSFMLKR